MATTTTNQGLLAWMKGASWLNVLVGVVVFATPFFTGGTAATYASALIVGALVFILAATELQAESTGNSGRVLGTSIVNLLAGLWLVAFPFAASTPYGYQATTVTAGVVLLVCEIYNLIAASVRRTGSAY